MKEIELKIKITDDQHKVLADWLTENAEFKGEEHHQEYYLNNPEHTFKYMHKNGYLDAKDYLRIRMTNKGNTINMKRWEIDPESNASKNIAEFESEIAEPQKLLNIFDALGYTDNILVDKTRQKYVAGNLEIVVDTLKGLGVFVEIEVLDHDDDTDKAMNQIFEFLKKLGITKFSKQTRGYTSMLWNPDYDFGEDMSLK